MYIILNCLKLQASCPQGLSRYTQLMKFSEKLSEYALNNMLCFSQVRQFYTWSRCVCNNLLAKFFFTRSTQIDRKNILLMWQVFPAL